MKTCTRCHIEKSVTEFYVRRRAKDGRDAYCKTCGILAASLWIKANKAHVVAYHAKWRASHIEYRRDKMKKWRQKNYEREVASKSAWSKSNLERVAYNKAKWARENLERCAATRARYKACKKRATTAWADQRLIQAKYDLAARMTRATGYQWDVDHIVPLKHPLVQGLHVENNLQVVTHVKNMSKGNRWKDAVAA